MFCIERERNTYIYIYICVERERERERDIHVLGVVTVFDIVHTGAGEYFILGPSS